MGLFRRGEREPRVTGRGQAALIGLVLLIGMVATVSVGILLVAGDTLERTEQQAETERVEGAFTELSQMMRGVASSSDTSSQVDLDLSDRGAVVMKNTSTMTIEYGNEPPTKIDFGTIEYEGDDGTRIAYQGGGVFSETGNETRIVSAPPISYLDDDDSETLSFPIIEPTEEGSISSGDISATKVDNASVEFSETIEREEVTIEIQGPYYRGWETYFERQAGEGAIDSIDHDNNSVTVLLTQTRLDELYEYGVVGGEYIDPGSSNANITGPVLAGGDWDNIDDDQIEEADGLELNPINDEIEELITEADTENWNSTPSGTIDEGRYFEDGDVTITDDFDLKDGNITLVVDGDINIEDSVNVASTLDGYTLEIYTNETLGMGNNDEFCVDDCANSGDNDINASYVEIFGTDRFDLNSGGGTVYGEGTIFAPGAEVDTGGNFGWGGAIIADELVTDGGGNEDIVYDDNLEGGPDIDSEGGIPEIVYLNVAKHEIDLDT